LNKKGGAKAPPFFFASAMRPKKERGFSFLELIIYMLIVGVLAAFAVLVYRPTDTKIRYQAERLRTDLRHMQMLAAAWGVTLRLTSASGGYSVACVGSSTGPCASSVAAPCAAASIMDPASGGSFCVPMESGISLSPTATFDVDALGRPRTSAGALLTADTLFTMTASGSPTYTVTARPVTGFGLVTP
jgi:prepilin-type N-terminal cleavage/methylation domain-containing protein